MIFISVAQQQSFAIIDDKLSLCNVSVLWLNAYKRMQMFAGIRVTTEEIYFR